MMNKKKNFLVFSFLWLILLCFCEENTGDWTLVPQYFSGNEVYKEIIPTLILKSFPENISRVLTYEEEEFLNLKNLEKEKKAKEIKINELQRKKDLIFFQTKTEAEKHKASMEMLSIMARTIPFMVFLTGTLSPDRINEAAFSIFN